MQFQPLEDSVHDTYNRYDMFVYRICINLLEESGGCYKALIDIQIKNIFDYFLYFYESLILKS